MSALGDPKRARARARAEILARERDQLQHQLELVHTELVWVEERLSALDARVGYAVEAEADLDSLLASLDDDLDRDEQARKMISERLSAQRHGQAVSSRRLELLARERETVVNLFVAGAQLREARDIGHVRAAILEIVVNLIGCEQVGLFERDGARFRLTTSLGLDGSRSRDLLSDDSFIGRRLLSGEPFISRDAPVDIRDSRGRGLSVCLPFEAGGEVVAVLLLFELLEHKSALCDLDLELLELLRKHAGIVLTRFERDGATECGTTTWTQA